MSLDEKEFKVEVGEEILVKEVSLNIVVQAIIEV